MIGIIYKDESYAEVEGATAGLDDYGNLICWDGQGTMLCRISASLVLAYGRCELVRDLARSTHVSDVELRSEPVGADG